MTFPQGLLDAFETAERSIFRLETLPHYAGDPNYDRFVAGQPWQDTESKRAYCDLVSRRVADGVTWQRVHVVEEPLTDYLRFELAWSYPPNVAAGEDVRIVRGFTTSLPQGDFWLFDERELWWMAYRPDGSLISVECDVQGEHAALHARAWRSCALDLSVPLDEYMAPV